MENVTMGPQWTESMLKPVRGQDHLGLGSVVTDRILPALSPGINVLTPRPRYWSFYAFAVHDFWNRDLPRNRRSLYDHLQRLESMFSVACHLCENPDHGASAIGSLKVRPLVRSQPPTYRPDFKYVKTPGGGYRLYYASVMQSTGVIHRRDLAVGLPVDAVTPDLGVALAEAFAEAIEDTAYYKKYRDADEVPADVLKEYSDVACLCRLREPNAPDRELVVQAICHGGPQPDAAARRTALQMTLDVGGQTDGSPLNGEIWRQLLLYRRVTLPDTGSRIDYEPPDGLQSVMTAWRVSQLREMFNWSLNGMWRWVHDWGLDHEGDIAPLPRSQLMDDVADIPPGAVHGLKWDPSMSIVELLDRLRKAAGVSGALDDPWNPDAPVSEAALVAVSNHPGNEKSELAALLSLYLLSLLRVSDPQLPNHVEPSVWQHVQEGGRQRIGMAYALRLLRKDIDSGASVADVSRRIVWDHVVLQHQRVALAKLPEDTFRYHVDGQSIRFVDQPTGFGMNDPRFDCLSTVVTELGWTTPASSATHTLSSEGERMRSIGTLPPIEIVQ